MSEKRFVIGDDNIAMFEVIDMEKEELVCECRAVDVEKVVDLLNHFWDRILYEIKRSGDLHKPVDDLQIFLEDKGLVEEFREWSKKNE